MKDRIPNPATDDKNWQILFNTQFENLQREGRISTLWINGLSKLGLDQSKAVDVKILNKALAKYGDWECIQTQDVTIASAGDWNRLIVQQKIPSTNFVRTPEELYYCDEPDKWHDIMGHVPFLLDKEYTEMYLKISQLYLEAEQKGKKFADDVYTLISYIIEVGIINENGRLKAIGATLYSSAGELESAFKTGNYEPFDLDKVLALGYYDRSDIQKKYFVVDSIEHINTVINEYRTRYLNV